MQLVCEKGQQDAETRHSNPLKCAQRDLLAAQKLCVALRAADNRKREQFGRCGQQASVTVKDYS